MPSVERPKILDGAIVRAMTDAEYAQHELDKQEWLAIRQTEIDRAALKQAIFTKLGLTADEVAALLS